MDGLCDEERGGVEKDRTSGAERGCREEGYLEEGTGTGCESLKAAQGGRGDRERWGHMARRMGRPRNVGKAMLRGWRSYGIKGISVLETKVPECKG